MTWAWDYPLTLDEWHRGGSTYKAGQFDLAGWDSGWVGYNTTMGNLYPGLPGYGESIGDEDWYELGLNLPVGHYSVSVVDYQWDPDTDVGGSIANYGVVHSLGTETLIFETIGAGTTYFTVNPGQKTDFGLYRGLART